MKKTNFTFVIILAAAISLSNAVHAQVSINTSGNNPDASSMLDISSDSHGLLIPRMTLSQRGNIDLTASPTALLIYQIDNTPGFYYYDGSSWIAMQGANDGDWTISGNDMYSAVSGNIGIGTSTPSAKLEVVNGAFLASGSTGGTPTSGAGTRMMWIPEKDAFRAGSVTENQWDASNIGSNSTAMGYNTTANGIASTAMGQHTVASGYASTAMGIQTTASGNYSAAWGYLTTARSYLETSIGFYNTSYTPVSTNNWDASDRLFVIGNGTYPIASDAMVVLKSGNVGIGTATPSCPLEVNGYSDLYAATYGYLNSNGQTGTAGPQTNGYSIKASHRIMATEFNAVSDRRIKTNIRWSNNASDLQKIVNLKVSEYNYIDSIGKGNTLQKGFIAQEVEQIIPEAVNIHSDFIPDVFTLATNLTKTENVVTIELPKSHKLSQGDLIRLITPAGQLDKEVLKVVSANSFSVAMTEETESIFVYGKKVDDFRAVNYDYIFSTGIGAIQELSTRVEKLESSNNNLSTQVYELEKSNDILTTKVEQIDKLTAEVEALKSLIIQGSTLVEKTVIE